MVETTQNRSVIASSGIGLWIVGAIAIAIIFGLIFGAWKLWSAAKSAVTQEPNPVVTNSNQPANRLRFIRTPTKIIVVDDPIIPEGETALEDVYSQTEEYLGQTVIISGTISDIESASFFGLKQDEDTINVISLPEAIELNELEDSSASKGMTIRVTGRVKVLTREIEKTGFGLEFKNIDEAFWQDQLIIEAIRVEKIDGLIV